MFKGVEAKVQNFNFRFLAAAVISLCAAFLSACGAGPGANASSDEPAATVNGQPIKMVEVERAVKQQTQGQDSRLSQLELAGARLQVLQTLIEQEVMYQRAQKEGTVPSEDEVTVELNKNKTASGKSADQIQKEMTDAGYTEADVREQIRKSLATQKLVDKITGKVEPPKDSEIEAFYNGNKEAFVKKRGAKLAAIVIDPSNAGQGDTTIDQASAMQKYKEIVQKLQQGMDFAQLARENSEDQSRFQGGDLGYISEEDMKQTFPGELVNSLMSSDIGKIVTAPIQGKLYILKLQDRSDRDEALTLDSPGVRQQVTDSLVNNRKQLLAASYQAIAMNEAKIENLLAKKVVDNPNDLSGARPAPPANAATPANSATNAAPANLNSGSNVVSNANTAPKANTAKPAAPAPANANKGK
jgi:parvulin-like peptidyl-prolyl isomerase